MQRFNRIKTRATTSTDEFSALKIPHLNAHCKRTTEKRTQ